MLWNQKMKRNLIIVAVCLLLTGCGAQKQQGTSISSENVQEQGGQGGVQEQDGQGEVQEAGTGELTYIDALGRTVVFSEQEIAGIRSGETKVGVLNGSFAEIWSLAGGRLAAVTEDAFDESREIAIEEETVYVGALKSPNLESLLSAGIDIAILSADIEEHVAMEEKLEEAGIKAVYHSVEDFEDYLKVLEFDTQLTGCADRYEKYGTQIAGIIEEQLSRQDDSHPTVLFIRAYSTGAKAKGSDSMTGNMLKEFGCINIADTDQYLTEDLSMEVILEQDPDYIFVTTMGNDDEAALQSVQTLLMDHPAWSSLTAVQNGHYYVLPKNMFHNKPNQRFGESYRMLADILYPETDA